MGMPWMAGAGEIAHPANVEVFVGRDEFEALERRLVKAEEVIRAQETQIKLLQTQLTASLTTKNPAALLFPEEKGEVMEKQDEEKKEGEKKEEKEEEGQKKEEKEEE